MIRRTRVVLVDDHADLRLLVRRALEPGPFDVVGEAGDGAEGVDAVARLRPDVVLLDLSMPRMDGLEALPLMKAASPESRVVVLSGFEGWRMGDLVRRLGANDYLEKGLSPAQLRAALSVVAGQPPASVRVPEAEYAALAARVRALV